MMMYYAHGRAKKNEREQQQPLLAVDEVEGGRNDVVNEQPASQARRQMANGDTHGIRRRETVATRSDENKQKSQKKQQQRR